MERAQRMINDMYLKMDMSHNNPYELHKPIKPETAKEKIDHLVDMFGISDK
jgi:hypothetical protein